MPPATPQVPAKPPPNPRSKKYQELQDFFSLPARQRILQGALAEGSPLNAERIITAAIAAVIKDDKLIECENQSIFDCVLAATQLQMLVGKEIGHAYLVPFKESGKDGQPDKMICTLMLGYRGLVALARRSGEIVSITAEIVFKKDKFEAAGGTGGHLVHEPDWFADDRGVPRGAYAFAQLKGGGEQWVVMGRGAIENIRSRSKAVNAGPWKRDKDKPNEISFDELEMWKKTAVRRLYKLLPITIETSSAVDDDDEREFGSNAPAERVIIPTRAALPAAEQSGAVRADDVFTQSDALKSDLRQASSAPAARTAVPSEEPRHDADGVVLGEDGKPEEPTAARAAASEEKKAKPQKAASSPPPGDSAPPPTVASSKPAEPAKVEERKPAAAGAGLSLASGIIDRAEAMGEIGQLVELDNELTAAIDAGKIGTTHTTRAKKAIESARARILANQGGGDQ